jgi:hypothetical protein
MFVFAVNVRVPQGKRGQKILKMTIFITQASSVILISQHLKPKVYGWNFRHQHTYDVAGIDQPALLKYSKSSA